MASSMASSLLRRASHFASPYSILVSRQRSPFLLSLISSFSSRLLHRVRSPLIPACARAAPAAGRSYASSAAPKGGETSLKRVLDSEIQCAEEEVEGQDQDESLLPKNFPFTIVDNPGDQTITLKREFGSETVDVSVFMEPGEGEEEEEDQDDATGSEEETTNPSNISLVVAIEKGKGPTLEFCCTINPEEINIDSLTLKSPDFADDQSPYEGPEFTDLDESLQKEFYNFLERRGIKPSLASFLQDYMIKKEEREYLTWLKNMKEFIEK